MRLPEVERLCRAIVPGAEGIEVQLLGKGLISETYRITRAGATYTLKVPAEFRAGLGADPAWEAAVLERAASAGLAPRLVYVDVANAVVLAQWIAGRSWTTQDAADSGNTRRVAELLRRVHSLSIPAPARAMNPLSWADLYDESLKSRTAERSDPVLRTAALARAASIAELPRTPGVVCHSDLHILNLLQTDRSLMLLDWEYAHVADPFWDLAGWSANNDLAAQTQWDLLQDYLGGAPVAGQWQRLRLLLWLYDYVCLLWSRLYLNLCGESVPGIAERARLLDARLRLPANYAA
jgi:thiamine kinase-like enzyme